MHYTFHCQFIALFLACMLLNVDKSSAQNYTSMSTMLATSNTVTTQTGATGSSNNYSATGMTTVTNTTTTTTVNANNTATSYTSASNTTVRSRAEQQTVVMPISILGSLFLSFIIIQSQSN